MLSFIVVGYCIYLCAQGNPEGACKFMLLALVLCMLFPGLAHDLNSGNLNVNIERQEVPQYE